MIETKRDWHIDRTTALNSDTNREIWQTGRDRTTALNSDRKRGSDRNSKKEMSRWAERD